MNIIIFLNENQLIKSMSSSTESNTKEGTGYFFSEKD